MASAAELRFALHSIRIFHIMSVYERTSSHAILSCHVIFSSFWMLVTSGCLSTRFKCVNCYEDRIDGHGFDDAYNMLSTLLSWPRRVEAWDKDSHNDSESHGSIAVITLFCWPGGHGFNFIMRQIKKNWPGIPVQSELNLVPGKGLRKWRWYTRVIQ